MIPLGTSLSIVCKCSPQLNSNQTTYAGIDSKITTPNRTQVNSQQISENILNKIPLSYFITF